MYDNATRIVTYYNNLIDNNVIAGTSPVTLDWMRQQRILEGRKELNLRFGYAIVDSVLGEPTSLAIAKQYLDEVHDNRKYELLPEVARLLADECTKMLEKDNIASRKYSYLAQYVSLDVIDIESYHVNLYSMLNFSFKVITPHEMKCISNFISKHNNIDDEEYCDVCFGIYIMNLVYTELNNAFNEIKEQIECITKN